MFKILKRSNKTVDLEDLINNNGINAIKRMENIEYLMSTQTSKESLNHFLLACYQGRYEIVKLFDSLNAYIHESVDIRGNYCFHLCCCKNNENSCKIIEYFVDKYGSDVFNRRNTSGLDVFSFCCVNNLSFVVCFLLEHYKDSIKIESNDNAFRKRPISLCISLDNFECYKHLVDFGSKPSDFSALRTNKQNEYKKYYETHINSGSNKITKTTDIEPDETPKKGKNSGKARKGRKKANPEKVQNQISQKTQQETNNKISGLQNQIEILRKNQEQLVEDNAKMKQEITELKETNRLLNKKYNYYRVKYRLLQDSLKNSNQGLELSTSPAKQPQSQQLTKSGSMKQMNVKQKSKFDNDTKGKTSKLSKNSSYERLNSRSNSPRRKGVK